MPGWASAIGIRTVETCSPLEGGIDADQSQISLRGIFLVAVGGVLVVADLAAANAASIADALRYWPLAVVALGLGLALRRTRFSLPGGMLAAAVPGLVLGGAFAMAPRIAEHCGGSGERSTIANHAGTFDGPATVSVTGGCGELVINTRPGPNWALEAANSASRMPRVSETAQSLSIDTVGSDGWRGFDGGRDTWRLVLPTSAIEDLSIVMNAGLGTDRPVGCRRRDPRADVERCSDVGRPDRGVGRDPDGRGEPGTPLCPSRFRRRPRRLAGGQCRVDRGVRPTGLGLRVTQSGELNGISINGVHESDSDWQSADYAAAPHHADLNVTVNLGSVEINPIGGCK